MGNVPVEWIDRIVVFKAAGPPEYADKLQPQQ